MATGSLRAVADLNKAVVGEVRNEGSHGETSRVVAVARKHYQIAGPDRASGEPTGKAP